MNKNISPLNPKPKTQLPKLKTQNSKLLALLLLFCLQLLPTFAATKQQADKLYADEEYEKAASIYEEILANEGEAAELYYNLGNCYYKSGEIAPAILNYERALLLNPSDAATKANLELARSKTSDKVAPRAEMFFIGWWRDFTNSLSLTLWTILGIVSFVLLLTGILVYAFLSNVTYRKLGAYGAIVCLLLVVVTNLCALSQHLRITNRNHAIILTPAVTVKSSPSESSTDLFVIHEGAKVEILDDSMNDWREVKLEEGKIGWVEKNTLERI